MSDAELLEAQLQSIVSFFIDELPMTRNVADRRHWTALANEKKRWLYLIREKAGNIQAAEPCRVTITFRTMRANDKDNLHARAKSPLDALQRAGIITNDDPQTITLEVKQDLVKHRRDCGTLIEISELLPFDEPTEPVFEYAQRNTRHEVRQC